MAHIEELTDESTQIHDAVPVQTPENKHEEIARALVPIREGCHVLEEILFKHYRNLQDPRVKAILSINHQLKKLRNLLSITQEDTSMYYQVAV